MSSVLVSPGANWQPVVHELLGDAGRVLDRKVTYERTWPWHPEYQLAKPKPRGVELVCISDTHGLHAQVELPKPQVHQHLVATSRVLVHAGDCTKYGSRACLKDFLGWFAAQPGYATKILVPGNHDAVFQKHAAQARAMCREARVTLLIDEGCELDGVRFWGSPWTPEFCNWSFMLPRLSQNLLEKWDAIPQRTDVLITHGPSYLVRDFAPVGGHVGCELLAARVGVVQPQVHVFGHIHEGYGMTAMLSDDGSPTGITYVNAATCDEKYRPVNPAISIAVRSRA